MKQFVWLPKQLWIKRFFISSKKYLELDIYLESVIYEICNRTDDDSRRMTWWSISKTCGNLHWFLLIWRWLQETGLRTVTSSVHVRYATWCSRAAVVTCGHVTLEISTERWSYTLLIVLKWKSVLCVVTVTGDCGYQSSRSYNYKTKWRGNLSKAVHCPRAFGTKPIK